MTDVTGRPPVIGDPTYIGFERDAGNPLLAFITTMAAVARVRAGNDERIVNQWLERLVPVARQFVVSAETLSAIQGAERTPGGAVMTRQLEEEMWFYTWSYRSASPDLPRLVPPDYQFLFGEQSRRPTADSSADDAETILDSLDKFIDKLPGPLKKILHGILEVLKLTRGLA
jgi:hypothetical protein